MFAEDFLNSAGEIPTVTLTDVTTGTITGAAIGLLGGTLYAYFRQKKYIPSMIIGTLIGGVLSRVFMIQQ